MGKLWTGQVRRPPQIQQGWETPLVLAQGLFSENTKIRHLRKHGLEIKERATTVIWSCEGQGYVPVARNSLTEWGLVGGEGAK